MADASAGSFSATVAAVTAAFGDPTRREIYLFAREAERGVTAGECAERFALHPNVARHHLDKLVTAGHVEVHVDRAEGAGAGRPSKRYRAVARDLDLAPRTDDLLVALLGSTMARLPVDVAAEVAEEVGEAYGRRLAESLGPSDRHRSMRAALGSVAEALTAHGFAARTETKGGSLRIVSDHCPFGAAAIEHPVLCAVDRGIVKGMLAGLYGESAPATEACRAMGDTSCITSV